LPNQTIHSYQGFGELTTYDCDGYKNNTSWREDRSRGLLEYLPEDDATTTIDEMTMLLNGGRLNSLSRSIIENGFTVELNQGKDEAFRYAVKAVIASAEFHGTNVFKPMDQIRPDFFAQPPPYREYKAIVYVMLRGGLDTFNMIVPHSNCINDTGKFLSYCKNAIF